MSVKISDKTGGFEIKQMNQINIMNDEEKALYLEKLKCEIDEYRHREQIYERRRRDLMEIESAYRAVQQRTA